MCFRNKTQLFSRQDAGGVAAATLVGVPKKPLHLPTNYRTHSGILNAAAAVVDILKHYFPMVSTLPLSVLCLQGCAMQQKMPEFTLHGPSVPHHIPISVYSMPRSCLNRTV